MMMRTMLPAAHGYLCHQPSEVNQQASPGIDIDISPVPSEDPSGGQRQQSTALSTYHSQNMV